MIIISESLCVHALLICNHSHPGFPYKFLCIIILLCRIRHECRLLVQPHPRLIPSFFSKYQIDRMMHGPWPGAGPADEANRGPCQ